MATYKQKTEKVKTKKNHKEIKHDTKRNKVPYMRADSLLSLERMAPL